MSTALYWFRQDLRCQDNPALTLACKSHDKIIPLYIKEKTESVPLGGAQYWWLHHSLTALKKSLQEVKLDLFLRQANPLNLIKELCKEHEISAVYWNRCYEPEHIARDQKIKAELKSLGIAVISCNGSLLNEPWDVVNQSGTYFKVFTPYWRHCLKQTRVTSLMHISSWPKLHTIASESLKDWDLLPTNPNWAIEFADFWQPGEEGALEKLAEFTTEHMTGYKHNRDIPGQSGTSRLSPHLHFGEVSPQQIWMAIHQAMHHPHSDHPSAQTYLSELGWREFCYQLMYHFPSLPKANFKEQFNHFPWQNDKHGLAQWKKGVTGYPIVDAGMRELWHTGYMHNRVRMIVASFLTKDLMIDWREGAAWFWDTLLDADLANNSANWQWVAGSGADASPYYRIFNPVLQGEKFDPQGDYVKRWVPELAKVDKKWIHNPWDAPKGSLPIVLGNDYPLPIVDHAAARDVALTAYKRLKGT